MNRNALPVVDGDDDNADLYGFATTLRGALRIAHRDFVDPIARIERMGPVTIRGQHFDAAWLALTVWGV
jgi:hypothetical protein